MWSQMRAWPDFTQWAKDKKSRPDMVGLQNLTNPWRNRIANLTDVYPFSASALHHEQGVKEDIISRFPILDASVYRPAGGRTAVHATVMIEGQPVQVFVINPNKATGQARWTERNQYLGLVSQWVASQAAGQPAMMLGDWIITPWSPFYADVFEQSGLKRGDAGLFPPATHTLAHLPDPAAGAERRPYGGVAPHLGRGVRSWSRPGIRPPAFGLSDPRALSGLSLRPCGDTGDDKPVSRDQTPVRAAEPRHCAGRRGLEGLPLQAWHQAFSGEEDLLDRTDHHWRGGLYGRNVRPRKGHPFAVSGLWVG